LVFRLLTLFSYNRHFVVDRNSRRVNIRTQYLWVLHRSRSIGFDDISRIAYRAQLMPNIGWFTWLPLVGMGDPRHAAFFISVVLKDRTELRLFSGWETQPGELDVLDRLLGEQTDEVKVGDEEGARIVSMLKEFLGVRISPG
jgi:hypothetical protein